MKFIDKKVVYCGYLVNQWGHFLVEATARLWYSLKNDSTADSYVFFLGENEQREIKGNYKEFFELLGIYDKIELINKPTRYRQVIVPPLGYKSFHYYSDEFKGIYEKIAQNIKPSQEWEAKKKILLTRSSLDRANVSDFGLETIDNYFSNNGYAVISPEKISLSYLIFLIRNADVCASFSGTLPHNMLFAEDGQKLIIIERNVLSNEIQVGVNIAKELDVTYIDANIGIYPINVGAGPYITAYPGMLEKFTVDNNLNPPDKKYLSSRYIKKCVRGYMKHYNTLYAYEWFMLEWMIKYTDYMYEAYNDSLKYCGEYLKGERAYKFSQNFKKRYIIKNIKRLLKKLLRKT